MTYDSIFPDIELFWVQDYKKADVAYSGIYVDALCKRVGWLFSYIDASGLDIQSVLHDILQTNYRNYIEEGHPHYISGCTTAEFAKYILIDRLHLHVKNTEQASSDSDAYRIGWCIAMFQWMYNISWNDIERYCKVDMVREVIPYIGYTSAVPLQIFEELILRMEKEGYKRKSKDLEERIDELRRISDETRERAEREFEAKD